MELELRHLRMITAIADAGTVTRAGEVLHLSQSAISHSLTDIESRLNAPLFHRIGRRMVPTPAGRQLLEMALQVLATVGHAEDAVRASASGRSGTLRLSTECYTCYHWLSPLLRPYRAAHPGVEIDVVPGVTANPVQALLDGRLDLAIVTTPVRNPRLAFRRIFDDTMLVVVAPDHPLARLPYVRPQDLRDHTLLLYAPREDSFVYQRVIARSGVTPRAIQQVPLTEAIIELAKANLGVGLLSDWAVAPHLKTGGLRGIRLTERGHRRSWYAATLKATAASPPIADFIDLLAAHPPTMQAPSPIPPPANVRSVHRRATRPARRRVTRAR